MDQSTISEFAKEAVRNLRNSFFQGRYYTQMNQDSEEESDMPHSLFYSVHQNNIDINNGDSIPLTLSNAYSDRSQLVFEQEDSDSDSDRQEESLRPSAIYLDQPETSLLPNFNPKSLSESLLPTSASVPKGIDKLVDRKYRDPIFMMLYIFCFSLFLLSGLITLFTTNSHALEDYIKGSTFKTIKDSAGVLTIIIATALIIGTIWIIVLRTFTKLFVWGTVVCIPITLTIVFIWTLVESFQNYYVYQGENKSNQRDLGLTIVSFIPLVLNFFYVALVYSQRQRISKTISVIELACDVIRFNPGIFIVSILLLVVFILFSIVWIVLFNRLWLIGHLGDKSSSTGTLWVVNNYVYSLAAFYIFIYMWTSKLLIYMERFALSAIVAQWYFHRHEISKVEKPWKVALYRACTTSFGTIAFGSFVLAVIQFMQFLTRVLRKYSKSNRVFATVISYILRYIDMLVSTFSNYTISLSAITGENFCAAAKSATKIFRRNLLTGLFGDLLTQVILYIGTCVIALTSGFAAYVYATHNLHSPHGFVIGFIATLMPWYISQFFTYTMMSIIDASFLCYAIDLDTGTVHLSAAHTAFSGFD